MKIIEIIALIITIYIFYKIFKLFILIIKKTFKTLKYKNTNKKLDNFKLEKYNNLSQNEKMHIKGQDGENEIINYLKQDNTYYKKILNNIYLPKNENEYNELDVILICNYGIFLFEIKNYSGWIFGDRNTEYWTKSFKHKSYKFYNPIMQNLKHLDLLKKFVNIEKYNLYKSVVLFMGNAKIKNFIENKNNDYILTKEDYFRLNYIIKENNIELLSNFEVDEIYNKLKIHTNVSEATKLNHINKIKRYNYEHKI